MATHDNSYDAAFYENTECGFIITSGNPQRLDAATFNQYFPRTVRTSKRSPEPIAMTLAPDFTPMGHEQIPDEIARLHTGRDSNEIKRNLAKAVLSEIRDTLVRLPDMVVHYDEPNLTLRVAHTGHDPEELSRTVKRILMVTQEIFDSVDSPVISKEPPPWERRVPRRSHAEASGPLAQKVLKTLKASMEDKFFLDDGYGPPTLEPFIARLEELVTPIVAVAIASDLDARKSIDMAIVNAHEGFQIEEDYGHKRAGRMVSRALRDELTPPLLQLIEVERSKRGNGAESKGL